MRGQRMHRARRGRLSPAYSRREYGAMERRPGSNVPPPEVATGMLPRPHICFVAPNTWPVFSGDPDNEWIGGAEVQQSILARALARGGHRVSMICLDYGQPQSSLLDGVTLYKTHRPDAGVPGLGFIH